MDFRMEPASETDWNKIPDLIKQFELDNTDLQKEQFVVCKSGDTLCGFGRLRSFNGFDLFSSLGVLPEYRSQQVGQLITKELLRKANQKVFFVTSLPQYFSKHGFETIESFPDGLKKIVESCALSCGCVPVVMAFKSQPVKF